MGVWVQSQVAETFSGPCRVAMHAAQEALSSLRMDREMVGFVTLQ